MSSLLKVLDEIPDISVDEVTLEQILSQFPHLNKEDPVLYLLYMRFNENSMTDNDKEVCEKIIVKLQKNITIMNKINLEKFKEQEEVKE